jgi:hypothetical protein
MLIAMTGSREGGRPNREETHGSYRRVADYRVSTTDPDATIMPTKGQGWHLGYHTHYVVDGGKKRIILNVLVTPSEVMENQPMLDLLWRTRFRWKLRPRQITGDTTYGTRVPMGEPSIATYGNITVSVYAPITRLQHMRKRWPNAKSGSSLSSRKPNNGMGCGGFVSGSSGESTARPW